MGAFKRNGSPESSVWKTDVDNFQGYVRAKLEDVEKEQTNQWKTHRDTRRRLSSVERNAQYQLGGLAVIAAFITILISAYGAGLIPL